MTTADHGSRARDRGDAVPDPSEAARLAAAFGGLLRAERHRAGLTQRQLAEVAGLHVHTVELLEAGWRRPSTVSVWRLARALRPRGTLRDRVALDEQLRRAAGESLRVAATRAHRRREAVRAELLAEAGAGPVLGDHEDNLGAAILAELSAHAAFGQGPAVGENGEPPADGRRAGTGWATGRGPVRRNSRASSAI